MTSLSAGKATNSFAIVAANFSLYFQTATTGSLLLAQTPGNLGLMDRDRRHKERNRVRHQRRHNQELLRSVRRGVSPRNSQANMKTMARPGMEESVSNSNTQTLTGKHFDATTLPRQPQALRRTNYMRAEANPQLDLPFFANRLKRRSATPPLPHYRVRMQTGGLRYPPVRMGIVCYPARPDTCRQARIA